MTFEQWIGTHDGNWRTWLEPRVLHDESPIAMTVAPNGDRRWRIDYSGAIADDPVEGWMVVSDDGTSIEWNDSWHTAGSTEQLTSVDGAPASYEYGPTEERWTWSIEIAFTPTQMVIRHYNRPPGGEAALAVEMTV